MDKEKFFTGFRKSLKELIPILERNNSIIDKTEYLSSSINNKYKTAVNFKTIDEYKVYLKLKNLLMAEKTIYNNYSEKYIESQLINLFHEILKDKKNINDTIEKLFLEFSSEPKKFIVYSKLENVQITNKTVKIIDSTLKTFTNNDIPKLDLPNDIFKKLLDKEVIYTTVCAKESGKAEEKATYNFFISFNFIKLFIPNANVGIQGDLYSSVSHFITVDKTLSSYGSSTSHTGNISIYPLQLSDNFIEHINKTGYQQISKNDDLFKIFKKSLYWYGLGLKEKYDSVKLLNFVTVLEATLKKKEENQELSKAVSERGALFLSDDYNTRIEIKNQLSKIYRIRGSIVHRGEFVDDKELSRLAQEYSRQILINIMKKSKHFKGNFNSFIDYLDNLKFKSESNCPT